MWVLVRQRGLHSIWGQRWHRITEQQHRSRPFDGMDGTELRILMEVLEEQGVVGRVRGGLPVHA